MTRVNSAYALICVVALTAWTSTNSSTASVFSLSSGAAANVATNENEQKFLLEWGRQGTKAMASTDVSWLERNFDDRAIYTEGTVQSSRSHN